MIWTLSMTVQFSSVTQSCPTLCDPMNWSTPGLPVHHQLRSSVRFMSIESVMPSSHLILCYPLLLLPPIPPSIRLFSNESTLRMRWPKYKVSALASVLPKKSQGWSPSEWTGWISLQSKGLSRVFSNTSVQKHQFFGTQLSYSPTLTSTGEGNVNPLQCSCLENARDGGASWAAIYGVARVRHNWSDSAAAAAAAAHAYMMTEQTIALTRWTFGGKVMSLLFNMFYINFCRTFNTSKLLSQIYGLLWWLRR